MAAHTDATRYRFDVTPRPGGKSRFTCDDIESPSAHGLARAMVEIGAVDAPVEVGRAGRVDWTSASLHMLAARTLSEGDKGFTRGVYAPFPPRDLHPALAAAVAREHAKRARA